MPNPRRQDRELDALYDSLPSLRCQGFCHDSCGPIECSVRERARVVQRGRKALECGAGASCSMLTEDRRCGVYDVRPMICRLWGLVKRMRCPYGCEPERWLQDGEAMRLLLEAERIGGPVSPQARQRIMERAFEALDEERISEIARAVFQPATVQGRIATLHRTGVRAPYETPGVPVGETAMGYPKR